MKIVHHGRRARRRVRRPLLAFVFEVLFFSLVCVCVCVCVSVCVCVCVLTCTHLPSGMKRAAKEISNKPEPSPLSPAYL